MKKPINEIKKLQLIAGLITESEYHESMVTEGEAAYEYEKGKAAGEKEEEQFGGVNEYSRFGKLKYLSPAGFDRASGLVKTDSVQKMLEAAEDMMEDLTNEGFEVMEIREFFTQLIANDI
jgi:hypothetical protein